MFVCLAVLKELRQTHRQNRALYINLTVCLLNFDFGHWKTFAITRTQVYFGLALKCCWYSVFLLQAWFQAGKVAVNFRSLTLHSPQGHWTLNLMIRNQRFVAWSRDAYQILCVQTYFEFSRIAIAVPCDSATNISQTVLSYWVHPTMRAVTS